VILIHTPTTYSVNKTRKTAKPRFGQGMFREWNASLISERGVSTAVQNSVNLQRIMVNILTQFAMNSEHSDDEEWPSPACKSRLSLRQAERLEEESPQLSKSLRLPERQTWAKPKSGEGRWLRLTTTRTNPESAPISDSGVVRSRLNLNKNSLRQIGTNIG
jgi:hypothetical protein